LYVVVLSIGAQAVVQTLVGTAQGNTVGKVNVLLNFPTGLVRDDSSITQLRTRYWFLNLGNSNGDQLRILDVDYANGTLSLSLSLSHRS